ncbi:helix-turn-helix domain-containing protein [Alcaligenaceae bacterium]|nr:helix-turn-helix domain-containing protein [Alcaligenaceae bacterium]
MSKQSAPQNDLEDPQGRPDVTRYFVGAFAKGLTVIRAFGEGATSLTLSEVAARTGMTRAGARRFLLTLEDLGYVRRENERYFCLTPKVLSLGYAYLSSLPLWSFAEPVLETLVEEVGETSSIVVLDDVEIVYVWRVAVHRILSQDTTIGTRRPAYCNSMGRVLLSSLNESQLKHYFSHTQLRPYTKSTITDEKLLREELERVRVQRYAWVQGEMEPHISGLSVPVFDADNRVCAALNVSFNRLPLDRDHIVQTVLPRLSAAAQRLTSSLRAAAPHRRG